MPEYPCPHILDDGLTEFSGHINKVVFHDDIGHEHYKKQDTHENHAFFLAFDDIFIYYLLDDKRLGDGKWRDQDSQHDRSIEKSTERFGSCQHSF